MKKLISTSILTVSFLLLGLTSVESAFAQNKNGIPPFEEDGKPGLGPKKPNQVPVDGGASVLLAAGAALGLKKLRDYQKRNRNIDPAA